MADSLELPALYVEGDSDLHTIIHLLRRHGITLEKEIGPVIIKKAKNDRGVLNSMRTATRASTLRPVGFVIDADKSVSQRWQSVCEHLKDLGLTLPGVAPGKGFIGDSTETKSRVGVWIMPDNKTDEGRLENLVQTLVPDHDNLFALAKSSTSDAVKAGSRFAAQDLAKAELHCWLAWQEEPGRPFGTALKARFFRHDSDVAKAFVDWFKLLYGLS
jgi:hypothetical protein